MRNEENILWSPFGCGNLFVFGSEGQNERQSLRGALSSHRGFFKDMQARKWGWSEIFIHLAAASRQSCLAESASHNRYENIIKFSLNCFFFVWRFASVSSPVMRVGNGMTRRVGYSRYMLYCGTMCNVRWLDLDWRSYMCVCKCIGERGAYGECATSQFSPLETGRRRCRMIRFVGDQDVSCCSFYDPLGRQ